MIIKIMQWYHKYLFLHSKDWQTRSRLVEADFERRLDLLAVKDEHFMVRQTLASCRIGKNIALLLAEDENEIVIRTIMQKFLYEEKIIKKIKDRNLPYFDSVLKTITINIILTQGRFATVSKYYIPTEKEVNEHVTKTIKESREYYKLLPVDKLLER